MDELEIIKQFCLIDDFYKKFQNTCYQQRIEYAKQKIRHRPSRTALSEVLTILVLFHWSGYRTFKYFYLYYVKTNLKHLFLNLVGYSRFIQLTSDAFFPLFCLIREHRGIDIGIAFIDSTVLTACHIKRAYSHKTFKNQAKWGKTTVGFLALNYISSSIMMIENQFQKWFKA